MKDRDEFIQSVWEKSEKAKAEEMAVKARRRSLYKFGAAAAACAMLLAGAAGLGGPQAVYEGLFDVVSDSAAGNGMTEDGSTYSDEFQHIEMAGTTADDQECVAPAEPGSTNDGSDSNSAAMPGMSLDGSLITDDLTDKDLYGQLREQAKSAQKTQESQVDGFMGYYFLPIGIEIESCGGPEAFAMYTGDEGEVLKYMNWFYNLPEEQVLTTEEFQSLKEIPTGYYKFTMDCSMDAETEGSDRVYWLVGEICLP